MYIVAGMLGFTELIAFLSIKVVVNGLARVKTEFGALTICQAASLYIVVMTIQSSTNLGVYTSIESLLLVISLVLVV